MGRLDFTTVATEVGIPHVVRHYEKDVRVSASDLEAWQETETTETQEEKESLHTLHYKLFLCQSARW